MQGNRSHDTRPELAVRRLVHAQGLRYRIHARPEADIRRTADMLFRSAKIAIFIDGCYWHGCPDHFQLPVTNVSYWDQKINRNRERDVNTTAVLGERGWRVLRFWEHEDPSGIAQHIGSVVRQAFADRDA